MSVLPVQIIPLAGRAVGPGGFVAAVLVGLALFAAYQATLPAKPKRARAYQ